MDIKIKKQDTCYSLLELVRRRRSKTRFVFHNFENLTFVAFKGQRSRIMTFGAKLPLEHSRNNITSYRLYGISHSSDYPYFDELSVKTNLKGRHGQGVRDRAKWFQDFRWGMTSILCIKNIVILTLKVWAVIWFLCQNSQFSKFLTLWPWPWDENEKSDDKF